MIFAPECDAALRRLLGVDGVLLFAAARMHVARVLAELHVHVVLRHRRMERDLRVVLALLPKLINDCAPLVALLTPHLPDVHMLSQIVLSLQV